MCGEYCVLMHQLIYIFTFFAKRYKTLRCFFFLIVLRHLQFDTHPNKETYWLGNTVRAGSYGNAFAEYQHGELLKMCQYYQSENSCSKEPLLNTNIKQ